MTITRESVDAAIHRYREMSVAGVAHWTAADQAAAEQHLPTDLVHHAVQIAEGRKAGPGVGV